jgi:hypothetical protein
MLFILINRTEGEFGYRLRMLKFKRERSRLVSQNGTFGELGIVSSKRVLRHVFCVCPADHDPPAYRLHGVEGDGSTDQYRS